MKNWGDGEKRQMLLSRRFCRDTVCTERGDFPFAAAFSSPITEVLVAWTDRYERSGGENIQRAWEQKQGQKQPGCSRCRQKQGHGEESEQSPWLRIFISNAVNLTENDKQADQRLLGEKGR